MSEAPLNPDFLELLRCPEALKTAGNEDDARLELVNDAWLVCHFNGYKYPIIDGIPVMLKDEGKRWSETPIDALPDRPKLLSES